jgi:hypothetical protein
MSSLQRHTGVQDSSMDNPYLRAYRRESGENRDSAAGVPFVGVWAIQLFGNILLLAPATELHAKDKSHYDNVTLHAIRRNAYND